jgi:hypothetical protein
MMSSLLLLNFSTGKLPLRYIQIFGTDPDRQETPRIVNGSQYMTNGHITMCVPYINILRMSRIIFRPEKGRKRVARPGTRRSAVFYLTHSGVLSPAIDSPAPRTISGHGPFAKQSRRQGKTGNDYPFNCFNSLF